MEPSGSQFKKQFYNRFNCEIVYFSGNSSYGESANVVSQQDLGNVSVGKVNSFVGVLKYLFAQYKTLNCLCWYDVKRNVKVNGYELRMK